MQAQIVDFEITTYLKNKKINLTEEIQYVDIGPLTKNQYEDFTKELKNIIAAACGVPRKYLGFKE